MSLHNANPADPRSILEGFAQGLAAFHKLKPVFPLYLASRAKSGLLEAARVDPEQIIAEVGDIKTIGDCKYAIPVTDVHGQKYRITVEVLSK